MTVTSSFGSLQARYTHNGNVYFGDGTTQATGYGQTYDSQTKLSIAIGLKPRQQNVVDLPNTTSFDGAVLTENYTLPAGTETTPTVNANRGKNSVEFALSGGTQEDLYDFIVGTQPVRGQRHGGAGGASTGSPGTPAHEVDFIFTDSAGDKVTGVFGADPTSADPYHLGIYDKSTHALIIGDDGDDGTTSHKASTTQNSEQANFFSELGVAGLTSGSSYDFSIVEVSPYGAPLSGVHAHVKLT